jgi:hypothetical protein
MMNIDGSTVDLCHCYARVIVSHTWACARWQVTIECIAIAEVFPFVFLLLSSYLLLIRLIATNSVSPENACFCLQFCSCYFFYCYVCATERHSKILLGNSIVRACSLGAMCVFPVMFSHLPQDCLHLSPYVLLFLFAGEVSACVCVVVSYILQSIESVIDSVYVQCV